MSKLLPLPDTKYIPSILSHKNTIEHLSHNLSTWICLHCHRNTIAGGIVTKFQLSISVITLTVKVIKCPRLELHWVI